MYRRIIHNLKVIFFMWDGGPGPKAASRFLSQAGCWHAAILGGSSAR